MYGKFEQDHFYTWTMDTFVAAKGDGADVALALWRVFKQEGKIERPSQPGTLAGFCQDLRGHWSLLFVGDPEKDESRLKLYPCPNFEDEIKPAMTLIADSIWAFMQTDEPRKVEKKNERPKANTRRRFPPRARARRYF